MLKWLYFALATVAVAALLLLLHDVRTQVRSAAGTVNDKLPKILEKTETTAETLAVLSGDIRQLRDLAGAPEGARDRTLVAYADAVLDAVENSGGTVGLPARLGGGLREAQPAKEWVVAARKEALWLTFRAASKAELLERLTKNKFGTEWQIQPAGAEKPVALAAWVGERHPTTGEAPK